LDRAEYIIGVAVNGGPATREDWETWVRAVSDQTAILWEKTTKSGKIRTINLREQLLTLEVISADTVGGATLRYVGTCRNDGTQLRPEQVVDMMERTSDRQLQLSSIHRQHLWLE
jgi:uncharacterized protein (DUF2344 family)